MDDNKDVRKVLEDIVLSEPVKKKDKKKKTKELNEEMKHILNIPEDDLSNGKKKKEK